MIYSCISSNGGINLKTINNIISYFIKNILKLKKGFINRILSWSIWAPLSKLTYAAFLNHITFLKRPSNEEKDLYERDLDDDEESDSEDSNSEDGNKPN